MLTAGARSPTQLNKQGFSSIHIPISIALGPALLLSAKARRAAAPASSTTQPVTPVLHHNMATNSKDASRSTTAAIVSAAVGHAEQEEHSKAVELFHQSLQLDPSNASVLEMLAQCFAELEQYEEAVSAAQAAIALKPEWADAHWTLARCQLNSGNVKQAVSSLRAAQGLDPFNPQIKTELLHAQSLLEQQLAHAVGVYGMQIKQAEGGQHGPGCVVWAAGLVLARYLVHSVAGLLKGHRVLELGSGTGIAGIAAAIQGAHVMLTDTAAMQELLAHNLAANQELAHKAGGSLHLQVLDWGTGDSSLPNCFAQTSQLTNQPCHGCLEQTAALAVPAPSIHLPQAENGGHPTYSDCGNQGCYWDWVIGSDLVYSAQQIPPLVATLAKVRQMHPTCTILIAHKHRHATVDASLLDALEQAGIHMNKAVDVTTDSGLYTEVTGMFDAASLNNVNLYISHPSQQRGQALSSTPAHQHHTEILVQHQQLGKSTLHAQDWQRFGLGQQPWTQPLGEHQHHLQGSELGYAEDQGHCHLTHPVPTTTCTHAITEAVSNSLTCSGSAVSCEGKPVGPSSQSTAVMNSCLQASPGIATQAPACRNQIKCQLQHSDKLLHETSNASATAASGLLPASHPRFSFVPKPVLLVATGLPAVGKSTILRAIHRRVTNSVYLDKDSVNVALLQQHAYFSKYYNEHVREQSYHVMFRVAADNLGVGLPPALLAAQDVTGPEDKQAGIPRLVILDGQFGDKLSAPSIQPWLQHPGYETKVVYFHCSGRVQEARMRKRGEARDTDKYTRLDELRREWLDIHERELCGVVHLSVDTELEDTFAIVERLLEFIMN